MTSPRPATTWPSADARLPVDGGVDDGRPDAGGEHAVAPVPHHDGHPLEVDLPASRTWRSRRRLPTRVMSRHVLVLTKVAGLSAEAAVGEVWSSPSITTGTDPEGRARAEPHPTRCRPKVIASTRGSEKAATHSASEATTTGAAWAAPISGRPPMIAPANKPTPHARRAPRIGRP